MTAAAPASRSPVLQIASDLHLEFYTDSKDLNGLFETLVKPTPTADVLILAGDIGYPEDTLTERFMEWACSNWPRVLWVFGNHEYYNRRKVASLLRFGGTLLRPEEKERLAEALAEKYENLTVLQNSSVVYPEFPGVRFLGTTLWTDVSPSLYATNDFTYIPFTQYDWVSLHAEARAFLERELDAAAAAAPVAERAIVITHYLPSYAMIQPIYKDSPLNNAFAAECDDLMAKPAVAAWICGHSHGQRTILEPSLCRMNARGYPGEDSVETYDPSCLLNLQTSDSQSRFQTAAS